MNLKRKFIPGDEWIYFKIYTGIKTADTLLLEISSIINERLKNTQIDKWFFIRFYDPDFHIRLRLLVQDEKCRWEVLSSMNHLLTSFMSNKVIWKVQLDTYNRELERYGHHLINFSETIFHLNTLQFINVLNLINRINDENLRWKLGLVLVDRFLNYGGYSIEGKLKLFEMLKENFGRELHTNKSVQKNISRRFNDNRKEIYGLLNRETNDVRIDDFLNTNDEFFDSKVPLLLNSIKKETNDTSFNRIVASHIHMSFNRLFKMHNRQAEYVCYEVFYLFYKSHIARNNSKIKKYNVVN